MQFVLYLYEHYECNWTYSHTVDVLKLDVSERDESVIFVVFLGQIQRLRRFTSLRVIETHGTRKINEDLHTLRGLSWKHMRRQRLISVWTQSEGRRLTAICTSRSECLFRKCINVNTSGLPERKQTSIKISFCIINAAVVFYSVLKFNQKTQLMNKIEKTSNSSWFIYTTYIPSIHILIYLYISVSLAFFFFIVYISFSNKFN